MAPLRWALAATAAVLAGVVGAASAASPDVERRIFAPSDLWRVVAYLCVPTAAIGLPAPCSEVKGSGEDGIALLPVSANHVLTVPTRRIPGIESPELLKPDVPNYWQAAWDARRLLEADQQRKLPRDRIALAVNSARDRSQDQLHLHTGCVAATTRAALARLAPDPGGDWQRLPHAINGARYRVRWIKGEDLAKTDVFGLLEPSLRASPAAMARQTIVVAGAVLPGGTPGFAILNAQGASPGQAHGENLLDFTCR